MSSTLSPDALAPLRDLLRRYWGYDQFRPMQAEAMRAVLAGRDSVVVLPTGGGKSLCFQAPALQLEGLAVVVSPLIALMQDQVDGLLANGVPAAVINSASTPAERRAVADAVRARQLKLLYLSPERLTTNSTLQFLSQAEVSFFAIDEAHCISDWGHDFRPEYRELSVLRERFPQAALHAYTATATARVRDDIARQLGLRDPEVLVGSFDRPNLVYRVERRNKFGQQLRAVLDRHQDEAGIIYCIRRGDVDELAAELAEQGFEALPYHAGLDDRTRRDNQQAFTSDRAKIIVATVAFGMGIDRSDVRFVIHAAAPKSLEHYQQESGRAGRDGLEAECCLFYSEADFLTWRKLQSDLPEEARRAAYTLLEGIERHCATPRCRHQSIVEYFGQEAEGGACEACDFCLGEMELLPDAQTVSQKILSCVYRLEQRFGGEYTSLVLCGSREERIRQRGHDRLSTFGLLEAHDQRDVRRWIEQLVGQGYLRKSEEHAVLQLTETGWQVLRGHETPRLMTPAAKPARESKTARVSWEGVDRGLFEALRVWRRGEAERRGAPPFTVLGDVTLRELARCRPSTREALLAIHGIGERKLADFGAALLEVLAAYCAEQGLSLDAQPGSRPRGTRDVEPRPPLQADPRQAAKREALRLFALGKSIEEISVLVQRAPSTCAGYIVELIEQQQLSDPGAWIKHDTFVAIRQAAQRVGVERMKPIFEALDGQASYEEIAISLACLRNEPPAASS